MEFLILLGANLLFCLAIFLYYRNKFKEEVGSDKIKGELEELVILFNRQAEVNISTLEAKFKSASELLDETKTQFASHGVMPTSHSVVLTPSDLKHQLSNKSTLHVKPKPPLTPSPSPSDVVSISRDATAKLRAKKKLGDIKREREAGMSVKDLAIKYDLSMDEIKLRINLPHPS